MEKKTKFKGASKVFFLGLLILVFSITLVSAIEWDNVGEYNSEDRSILVKNRFGIFGEEISKITPMLPHDVKVFYGEDRLVGMYNITLFSDNYDNVFKDMEYFNIKKGNEEIQRDINYKKRVKIGEKIVGDFISDCDIRYEEQLGKEVKVCDRIRIGEHKEPIYEWIEITDEGDFSKGENIIGLFTDVKVGDYVEYIPTWFGERMPEYATWTESFNTGLVAYYKFDESAGTVLPDNTGNQDGNVTNMEDADWKSTVCVINNCLEFGGVDEWVNLSGLVSENPISPNRTISFWINNSVSADDAYIFQTSGGAGFGVNIGVTAAADTLTLQDGAFTAMNIIPINSWVHIVVTFNSTSALSYMNGVINTSVAYTPQNITGTVGLGASSTGTSPIANSRLDEFAIWNRTLNSSEVTNLYNAGAGISPPLPNPAPTITLSAPVNAYNTTISTIVFSAIGIDNKTVQNMSYILNGSYNGTNTSMFNNTLTSFSRTLADGFYNWTAEVCDDEDSCVNATARNFTLSNYIINSQVFNPTASETASETFYTNITSNGTAISAGELIYAGTAYTSTVNNTAGNNHNLSNTIDIPTTPENKSFFWNFTLAGTEYSTSATNQTVNLTNLTICSTGTPYINFTFKDEADSSFINATIDTSTWSYYLGAGAVTKSLLFANNTENNYYPFCLNGTNETLHNTRSVQFSSPGYPQRKYDAVSDLTNTTTNKILWLLSSSDGIYSTIQVVDSSGNRISGVGVTIERQFSGLWTIVGQEVTDDSGSVTFWVNPDYDHRLTFVGGGCVGTSVTIRPTQAQYTQQLACGEGGDNVIPDLEGIKYSRSPASGIIQAGEYNFTYQVVSSKDNIINASFELVNSSNGAILNSTYSVCAPAGCIQSFLYTVVTGDNFKGSYYLDVGNGSFLLEADAHWVNVPIDTSGKGGLGTFMQDMIYVFQEWGDDENTADFNRLVVLFFFMCLGIAFLNYNFNMDSLNPGAFMIILTTVIFMGSIVGGTTGQGLFYFNNLSTSAFINNYLLVFVTGIISVSYFINIQRQAQR